jgi:hypothetical protein
MSVGKSAAGLIDEGRQVVNALSKIAGKTTPQ